MEGFTIPVKGLSDFEYEEEQFFGQHLMQEGHSACVPIMVSQVVGRSEVKYQIQPSKIDATIIQLVPFLDCTNTLIHTLYITLMSCRLYG